jgi:phosphatidylglycerophosphate synthase
VALFDLEGRLGNLALVLLAYALAVGLCLRALARTYPHARLGLCNLATLARLGISGVLFVALLNADAPSAALLVLALLSLSLDGVDGWLARREGLTSDFGARFDVEVDAAFALLLASYAAVVGATGPYVVLLGLPHYLFWGAKWVWPWLDGPLPPRFSRKAVCVMQIAALIVLLVPGLGGWGIDGMILAVVAALAWSFGRDILWLWQRRA